MDCRVVFSLSLVVLLTFFITYTEGRTKKVVIHVPLKVKKIKHTHTVYKTVHHHHTHREPQHIDHMILPIEEHEHFHHLHLHEESPTGQHTQPVPGVGIPEFLPDKPLKVPLDIADVLNDIPRLPNRLSIPPYRRN